MFYQLHSNVACNAMEYEHIRQTRKTMHNKIIVVCYIKKLKIKIQIWYFYTISIKKHLKH